MKTKLLLTTASVLLAVGVAVQIGSTLGHSPVRTASAAATSAVLPTVATLPPRPQPLVAEPQVVAAPTPAPVPTASAADILSRINTATDWPDRAAIAKELRAVSEPSALSVLLPALMENYGRGNTIFNEISDAIARLAQDETVETLEFMHWEATTQAGQGRKILRTIAAIRNPPAKRALAKLTAKTESPALAACAVEALKAMQDPASTALAE